jgi:UDP-N-acetylmuramoylalanine--D-glutamate ligase
VPFDLKNRRVLVLGLGASGMSMVRWLTGRGADVAVADSREAPPFAAQMRAEFPGMALYTGGFGAAEFADAELIAASPGVSLKEPQVVAARVRGLPVMGDIELFAQVREEWPQAKVIGITGSNGKSTVTEMVGAMSRAAGRRTLVAGNIGLPILDAFMEVQAGTRRKPDMVVLELSSFQLESTHSLKPESAAILNLSEDHLDRYSGMDEYAQAKARIFAGAATVVSNRGDSRVCAMTPQGARVFSFGLDEPWTEHNWGLRKMDGEFWLAEGRLNLMPVAELKTAGLHNAANALAALALCRAVNLPYQPLLDALFQFKGLPHRVEKIAEIRSISYYDDSKGTNVGATVAALSGMPGKVVLIAGGDGKGQDFSPLNKAVSQHARGVVLIGRDRELIAEAIRSSKVVVARADDMDEAVRRAAELASPGDTVLLSPACASFDMYRNYEHRAQAFADAVKKLSVTH